MWCPVLRVVPTAWTVLIRRLAVGPGNDFGDTWLWCPLERPIKNQMPSKSELGKRTRKEGEKEPVVALASTQRRRWCIDLTLSLCLQTHFVSSHKLTSRLRKQYTIIDAYSIVQVWSTRWIEDLVYDDEWPRHCFQTDTSMASTSRKRQKERFEDARHRRRVKFSQPLEERYRNSNEVKTEI